MARTYTLHTVDCPSAEGAPVGSPDDYPDARKHRCVYYADPMPTEVRVTYVDEIVPEAGEKENPGVVNQE